MKSKERRLPRSDDDEIDTVMARYILQLGIFTNDQSGMEIFHKLVLSKTSQHTQREIPDIALSERRALMSRNAAKGKLGT
jgi:hypothetical protein